MREAIYEPYQLNKIDGKSICVNCISDEFLFDSCKQAGLADSCSYCGESKLSVNINIVNELILETILEYYQDFQYLDYHISAPPSFESTLSTEDVVNEFAEEWPKEFVDDLIEAIGDDYGWVRHVSESMWVASRTENLIQGWERFSYHVKYLQRFTFLAQPQDVQHKHGQGAISVSGMLQELCSLIVKLNLFKTFEIGTKFFRSRESEVSLSNEDDFLMPPVEKAKGGRMNPEGIPYLYLGLDLATTIKEVYGEPTRLIYTGTFLSKKCLDVVDFTSIPEFPSIFQLSKKQDLQALVFLKYFLKSISERQKDEDFDSVNYIPTQTVSEYIKSYVTTPRQTKLNGMLFNSAENKGGINLVLFFKDNLEAKKYLNLVDIQKLREDVSCVEGQ